MRDTRGPRSKHANLASVGLQRSAAVAHTSMQRLLVAMMALALPFACGFCSPPTIAHRSAPAPAIVRCSTAYGMAVQSAERGASKPPAATFRRQRQHRPTNSSRTEFYNTGVKRLRSSSEVERLLKVYAPRNVKEYSMGISAYGRSGDWRRAMSLLDEMLSAGVTPDVITFSAAISACDKGGRWELALALLKQMRAANVPPNVYSYNAAISALASARQWERALELLNEMRAAGVSPNVITFNTAITACAKGGQWERALELLVDMRRANIAANVISFNAAISFVAARRTISRRHSPIDNSAQLLLPLQ